MPDIETLLERAQELKGRENGIRWELAEIAYHIVGSPLGRAGATRQLADVCGLSAVDAVEHWAKAYGLYLRIRDKSELAANWIRREFSVSHLYAMSELENKHELSYEYIVSMFRTLAYYKFQGERWSVEVLKMEVDADYPSGNAVNWRYHWNRVESHIMALLTFDGGLPVAVRAWARMYKGLKGKVK